LMSRKLIVIVSASMVAALIAVVLFLVFRKPELEDQPSADTPMSRIKGPSRGCRTCHKAIYDEWASSRHARAWLNPVFKELSNNYTRTECLSCHAPDRLLVTGFGNPPVLRPKDLAEGVNCIACHEVRLNVMRGPYDIESQVGHANEQDASYRFSVSLCASCHGIRMVQGHNKVTEFNNTLFAKQGFTCGNCHMPFIERPLSTTTRQITRFTGDHRALGGRDVELLKKATELSAKVEGGRLQVAVKSLNVGHFLPGGVETIPDVRFRSVIVDTEVMDKDGARVLHKQEVFAKPIGSEPEERLRPGETRTFSYDLGVKSGEARVRLLYKLYSDAPDEEATVMAEAKLSFKSEK